MKNFIFFKRRRGWIRIVEAFSTILIITGFLLIVINNTLLTTQSSEQIYDREYSILREIQLSSSLRTDILGVGIPIDSGEANFPADVKTKIEAKKTAALSCEAKICNTEGLCILNPTELIVPTDKDIYGKAAYISANSIDYLPRQLKIFCWEK